MRPPPLLQRALPPLPELLASAAHSVADLPQVRARCEDVLGAVAVLPEVLAAWRAWATRVGPFGFVCAGAVLLHAYLWAHAALTVVVLVALAL